MQYRRLSKRLRWRITDYYENRYQGKMFNEQVVLSELNPLLRKIVRRFNCREILLSIPFFTETSSQIVDDILSKLSLVMYLDNDQIIEEGTTGQQMYFIVRGGVKAISTSLRVSQIITDGCFFGELCLLLSDLRRLASIYAVSYCYLYTLTVADFNSTLEKFPVKSSRNIYVFFYLLN